MEWQMSERNAQISTVVKNINEALDKLREKTQLLYSKMQDQNQIIADLRAELMTVRPFKQQSKRDKEICVARDNGESFVSLGNKYNLSTSRIQQIYKRCRK
jgi:prefoldin subunit 5